MRNKTLTLEDLIASGAICLDEKQLSAVESSDAATNKWALETSTRDIGAQRKEGRPLKAVKVHPTAVRSLRLEIALWNIIEDLAFKYNYSVNRFIEESVVNYIDSLEFQWPEVPGLSESHSSWDIQTPTKQGFISLVNLEGHAA